MLQIKNFFFLSNDYSYIYVDNDKMIYRIIDYRIVNPVCSKLFFNMTLKYFEHFKF